MKTDSVSGKNLPQRIIRGHVKKKKKHRIRKPDPICTVEEIFTELAQGRRKWYGELMQNVDADVFVENSVKKTNPGVFKRVFAKFITLLKRIK